MDCIYIAATQNSSQQATIHYTLMALFIQSALRMFVMLAQPFTQTGGAGDRTTGLLSYSINDFRDNISYFKRHLCLKCQCACFSCTLFLFLQGLSRSFHGLDSFKALSVFDPAAMEEHFGFLSLDIHDSHFVLLYSPLFPVSLRCIISASFWMLVHHIV